MRTFLDANCLLRYMLDDIPEQAAQVAAAVEKGACSSPEYLCECAYVLTGKVYGFSRETVAQALGLLLDDIECEHSPAMRYALGVFAESKLDFPDCILIARAIVERAEILTFDKKLNSTLEKLR